MAQPSALACAASGMVTASADAIRMRFTSTALQRARGQSSFQVVAAVPPLDVPVFDSAVVRILHRYPDHRDLRVADRATGPMGACAISPHTSLHVLPVPFVGHARHGLMSDRKAQGAPDGV